VDGSPDLASRVVEKWVITTEITNRSKVAKLVPSNPYYCGNVTGQLKNPPFLSGSRLPIESEDRDFVRVPPSGKLVAKHVVLAFRSETKGQYTLYGFFRGNENFPDKTHGHQFPVEWLLRETVGHEFEFFMTLFDDQPWRTREVLGDHYKNLWRGQIISKPVKLKIIEAE